MIMSRTKPRPLQLFFGYLTFLLVTGTKLYNVEDGSCGTYSINNINSDETYIIRYSGGKVPFICRFGFIGRNDLSSSRICIEMMRGSFVDCDIHLKFYEGMVSEIEKEYTCGSKNEYRTWCGDVGKYVDIGVETGNRPLAKYNTSFSLRIYSEKDNSYFIVIITAMAITALVLAVLLVIYATLVCFRAKRQGALGAQKLHLRQQQPLVNAVSKNFHKAVPHNSAQCVHGALKSPPPKYTSLPPPYTPV